MGLCTGLGAHWLLLSGWVHNVSQCCCSRLVRGPSPTFLCRFLAILLAYSWSKHLTIKTIETLWKTICSCLPKMSRNAKTYSKDDQATAEDCNEYFINVGKSTVKKINDLAVIKSTTINLILPLNPKRTPSRSNSRLAP